MNTVTIKATSPNGFPVELTISDEAAETLTKRLTAACTWLASNEYTPPAAVTAPMPATVAAPMAAQPAAAPMAGSNGNGNGSPEAPPPMCGIHGTPMQRSRKFAGWYCPTRNADGSYCRSSIKDNL